MKRTIIWILVIFAFIAYGLLVWSWWIEGTAFQERQKVERELEDMRLQRRD